MVFVTAANLPCIYSTMSNRRKCAPPTRVDEEAKKRLSWNMCDDLKQLQLPAVTDSSNNPLAAGSGFSEHRDAGSLLVSSLKLNKSPNVSSVTETEDEGGSFLSSNSAHPRIAISPCHQDKEWRAQLDEFILQLPEGQVFPDNILSLSLCLSKTSNDSQLQISVTKESYDSESDCHEEVIGFVRSSFPFTVLEDILWLQRKQVLRLFQTNIEDCQTLKVFIFPI